MPEPREKVIRVKTAWRQRRRKRRGREEGRGAQVKLSENDGMGDGGGSREAEVGWWIASLCKSSVSSEQIREAGSHCRGANCC